MHYHLNSSALPRSLQTGSSSFNANSRFFLPSMDSIFDLIFESASVHNPLECQDSIPKLNKKVSMTSLTKLNPSGKRGTPATRTNGYSMPLQKQLFLILQATSIADSRWKRKACCTPKTILPDQICRGRGGGLTGSAWTNTCTSGKAQGKCHEAGLWPAS